MPKPKLVSFNICPFVQRSVILLKEKGVEYDIEFIDVYDPPAWFLAISPTGKVPVLQVGGEVLFESAVIGEYLDEAYPPSVHPENLVLKAKNRAWMEYTSTLYGGTFRLTMAKSKEDVETQIEQIRNNQQSLEEVKQHRPWFNGDTFSMADIAAAPYLVRVAFFKRNFGLDLLDGFANMQAWSDQLLERPSVISSIVEGFDQIMLDRMAKNGSYLSQQNG